MLNYDLFILTKLNEMIIYESLLTTLKQSLFFEATRAVVKSGLYLYQATMTKLSLSEIVKRSINTFSLQLFFFEKFEC